MAKVKRLKLRPSARDSRRYFLIKAGNSEVEDAILDYVGILGFAKSCYLKVDVSKERRWKLKKGYMIGSCVPKSLEEVRAALAIAGIKIKMVSGTLKGLRSKI